MARAFHFPSVSFSGAGFLGCYHVGAAACLLRHGLLLGPGEVPPEEVDVARNGGAGFSNHPPMLIGVSAGAMVAAAVAAGVTPDDGMNVVLGVTRRTQERAGMLDVLRPGFSLVDQVEDLLASSMKKALGGGDGSDYDNNLFLRRTRGGMALRIGLTDRFQFWPPRTLAKNTPEAYRYVDAFRDVDDAVAAAVLSSYIPGLTGPLRGASDQQNPGVRNAWRRVRELEQRGFVKVGTSGRPVRGFVKGSEVSSDLSGDGDTGDDDDDNERYWDGGLADVWPTVDDDTLVVTPINGVYSPNPFVCPALLETEAIDEGPADVSVASTAAEQRSPPVTGLESDKEESRFLPISSYMDIIPTTLNASNKARVGLNLQNAETFYRMSISSDPDVMQGRFRDGYDDTKRFLSDRGLLRVFSQ